MKAGVRNFVRVLISLLIKIATVLLIFVAVTDVE